MFYSILARRGIWPFSTECDVARVTAFDVQDYVRVSWLAPETLLIRYGLSRYDRKREGAVFLSGPSRGCAGLGVVTRHDPALDGQATRDNENNAAFDNPQPPPDELENIYARTHPH